MTPLSITIKHALVPTTSPEFKQRQVSVSLQSYGLPLSHAYMKREKETRGQNITQALQRRIDLLKIVVRFLSPLRALNDELNFISSIKNSSWRRQGLWKI